MDLSYMDPRAKVHKEKKNRRDEQQHSQSLYHPTSLIFVEHRPIFQHTTLSHPHFSIENTTTPPLLAPKNEGFKHKPNISPFQINSAQQTHHTPHPHASFPHTNTSDYTYPLVPTPYTLTCQLCFLHTFPHIQLPKHHTSLPLPI